MSDLLDFSPPGQTTFTLSAARARFYDAGTTTPRTVYTDQSETVPHPSPLIADASGRWPQAFASGGPVKAVVTRSDESTGYTLDPCEKVAASGAGASAISFSPTVALPFTNVQAAIEGAAASAATGFTPFGLGVTGSVALLADINATNIASGQYRFDATTAGTYPTGVAAADTGAVRIERETSGSAWMVLYHDTTDRVFYRRMTSSTWGAWRENIIADIGAVQGDILYRSSTAWTRLAPGTSGQVLQTNGAAANPSWVSPRAQWLYTSADQTITLNSAITLAHGLGRTPDDVQILLKCTTADQGYSVGDILHWGQRWEDNGGTMAGYQVCINNGDTTNINLIIAGAVAIANKSTYARVALTTASWRLVVRAR